MHTYWLINIEQSIEGGGSVYWNFTAECYPPGM